VVGDKKEARGWPLVLALLCGLGASCRPAAAGEEGVAGLASPQNGSTPESPSSDAPAPDATRELGCGEISACTDKCSGNCPGGIRKLACLMGCKSDCRAKGCSAAQKLFDELTDCIARSCWTSCIDGPTAECRACSEKECAAEAKKCLAHRCSQPQG
jgi:hypothetical protein